MLIRRIGTWVVILVLLLLIPVAINFGFAAGNTMPGSVIAGEGSNVISGFNISNIHYQLDSENPTLLSDTNSVQFSVSPSINSDGAVKMQLTHEGSSTWYTCTVSGGVNVTCTVPAKTITVQGITNIRVVAAQ